MSSAYKGKWNGSTRSQAEQKEPSLGGSYLFLWLSLFKRSHSFSHLAEAGRASLGLLFRLSGEPPACSPSLPGRVCLVRREGFSMSNQTSDTLLRTSAPPGVTPWLHLLTLALNWCKVWAGQNIIYWIQTCEWQNYLSYLPQKGSYT